MITGSQGFNSGSAKTEKIEISHSILSLPLPPPSRLPHPTPPLPILPHSTPPHPTPSYPTPPLPTPSYPTPPLPTPPHPTPLHPSPPHTSSASQVQFDYDAIFLCGIVPPGPKPVPYFWLSNVYPISDQILIRYTATPRRLKQCAWPFCGKNVRDDTFSGNPDQTDGIYTLLQMLDNYPLWGQLIYGSTPSPHPTPPPHPPTPRVSVIIGVLKCTIHSVSHACSAHNGHCVN